MDKFTVRPGYGSQNLLIEFVTSKSAEDFRADFLKILNHLKYTPTGIKDVIFYELIEFKSTFGKFYFELDEWGFFWISAENNQVIENLAEQLETLPELERYEVNWDKYKNGPKLDRFNHGNELKKSRQAFKDFIIFLMVCISILALIVYLNN